MPRDNLFTPLLKVKGFENVKLLPDGGCRFERRYTWRMAKCRMTSLDKIDECKISLNGVNCFLLCLVAFLSGGLISLLVFGGFVLVIGMRTEEHLLWDINKIIERSKKVAQA